MAAQISLESAWCQKNHGSVYVLALIYSEYLFVHITTFLLFLQQKGARSRVYKGHCSHVTNVRWTPDDKTLLSTGGMDATLLVWERISIGLEGILIHIGSFKNISCRPVEMGWDGVVDASPEQQVASFLPPLGISCKLLLMIFFVVKERSPESSVESNLGLCVPESSILSCTHIYYLIIIV